MEEAYVSMEPPKEYKRFLVEYPFDGGYYSITIHALDFDEAEKRCNQLAYATVLGTIEMTVPYWVGALGLAPAYCWIRNLFGRS